MMLKIKLILIVTTIMCLLSCKTDDILNKQQLEDMLFEMHLSDGVVHTLVNKNHIQNADTIVRYKAIFDKYKCSRDKFEKSMRIYSRKKETITQIYDNIKLRFDTMLKDIEGKSFPNFAKDIIEKFSVPLKNIVPKTDKYFENIETVDDFFEKLSDLEKDINENAAQDSLNVVQNEEQIETK
ncbi:MAG: DUF4296 domain-containing protein [Prevotellaceae bacterium]|jgi:ADP-glucose pyrophosphorylase|nr:DUF4296 domain-containing protein [Prevotellaceae bacterium]